jgi:hypothetical protein
MKSGWPIRVNCAGGKYHLVDDSSETPDTQCATYDFSDFMLIWEHNTRGGHGCEGREHGVAFHGSKAVVVLDANGWEVVGAGGDKLQVERRQGSRDARPAHVRNFLDCMRSRKRPVEDVEIGYRISTIALLGNVALRSKRSIVWDGERQTVVNGRGLEHLLSKPYRAPWKLPA